MSLLKENKIVLYFLVLQSTEGVAVTDDVSWAPKTSALRDLFLLGLHEADGAVKSERGRVASQLREASGVPHTSNNKAYTVETLRLMEAAGLILRDVDPEKRRTYEVVLCTPLTAEEVETLQANRASNLSMFAEPETVNEEEVSDDLKQLITDCEEAYRHLQDEADKAERTTDNGLVAINVAGALRSVGLKREPAKRVRHYLKMLGLAKAVKACSERGDSRHLWWWSVSKKPLNRSALIKLATGPQAYEYTKGRQGDRYIEDTARERSFAGATPAHLPAALCGPVEIRKAGEQKPTPPTPAAASAQATEESPALPDSLARIMELVKIIEELEKRAQTAEGRVEELEETVTRLTKEVTGLKEQLGAYAQANRAADEIIARYTKA